MQNFLLFTPNTGKYLSYFIDQFSQKVINFTDIFKGSFFSFFEFLYACSFPVLFIFVLNSSSVLDFRFVLISSFTSRQNITALILELFFLK